MSTKPRFLILGGCGFVGRHVVNYLVKNSLASKITVADKVLPEVAGLSATELASFKENVSFKQANLARENTIGKVFEHDGGAYDYVINVAAATKYSQDTAIYQENTVEVAKTTAKAAAEFKVKRYIYVSTAQVYDADKKASKEDSKVKPWTGVAKAAREAEEAVAAVNGLDHIIVRPAIIYGTGDLIGITPRIIIGAVYQKTGEKMEMLWTKELKLNTVAVSDVAKALVFLCTKGTSGQVYNLADTGESDQGSVSTMVAQIFGIKHDFMGAITSKLATSVSMKTVVETANDQHLKPWSDLLKEHKIVDSPLTPYLDEELLYNNSTSVNGTKITELGFTYDHPSLTSAAIKEVITDFENKGYFPKGLMKG